MRPEILAQNFYSQTFEKYAEKFIVSKKKVRQFAWFRFLAFIAIFLPVSVLGWQWLALPFTILFVILFFFLIKKNIQLEKQKNRYAVLKKLAEDELLALKHSFSHFGNGEEFLDTEHFFSYDLDLFGEGSLFQFINRTSTCSGKKQLGESLIHPSKEKEEIEKRQKAIAELAENRLWRINFRAGGNLFEETKEQSDELKNWSETELKLKNAEKVKWLIRILPALAIFAIVLASFGLGTAPLVLIVFAQFFIMYFFWGRINQYFSFFGRKSELLEKYMQLLSFIEEEEFESDYLNELQQKIKKPSAGKLFLKLKSLVKEFEYRQNILVGVALNGLFLWDIRCVYHLWNWHRKNHLKLADWLQVLAEFDALVSLSNYADNHPDFVYSEIQDGDFVFEARELGHPLLKAGKRINNDLEINGWSKAVIVTGANMAGKSTFLRTVGVNLILARMGAPVCAKHLKLAPIEMYTNMRTTDSLLKDESYFFAELKRIKGVLDKLQNGERIFVILDEMLKGTNSVDKLNGSKELVKKLVELKAVALIATHDLKLSELENDFPGKVFNKCFEIKIENEELVFDYKLSDGITQTMNATFLMKKMGII